MEDQKFPKGDEHKAGNFNDDFESEDTLAALQRKVVDVTIRSHMLE